jgi:hypothetical protein
LVVLRLRMILVARNKHAISLVPKGEPINNDGGVVLLHMVTTAMIIALINK